MGSCASYVDLEQTGQQTILAGYAPNGMVCVVVLMVIHTVVELNLWIGPSGQILP